MIISDFLIFNCLARKVINSALALPSTGGALILIFIESAILPTT
jgi:hypothetical protein